MATAAMIDDGLHINHFNPYTWSGTYGVPVDGSKWKSDGTYVLPYDSGPSAGIDTNRDLKVFNPVHVMRSGPMTLDEMPAKPAAPFPGFPTRKYEYDNGDLTWVRPDLNFNYVYDKDFIGSRKLPDYVFGPQPSQKKKGLDAVTMVLILIVILLILKSLKLR